MPVRKLIISIPILEVVTNFEVIWRIFKFQKVNGLDIPWDVQSIYHLFGHWAKEIWKILSFSFWICQHSFFIWQIKSKSPNTIVKHDWWYYNVMQYTYTKQTHVFFCKNQICLFLFSSMILLHTLWWNGSNGDWL